MDALNKAISIAGSQRALGEAIGLGQTAVANWIKRGGLVPVEHCTPIETALSGKVSRKELRPDDWQIHWPELAEPQVGRAPIAIETIADAQAHHSARKLDAPIDRRVSHASVAHAEFLQAQQQASAHERKDIPGAGQEV